MFQKEIDRYERVRADYEERIVRKMSSKDYLDWHEVLFSCHSCAIEGNSFTLDDTRVQGLMKSTAEALTRDIHPVIVAARFHGFFEFLHPFRDGNGRTGRLLSNWIMLHCGHPLIVIDIKNRAAYIDSLRKIQSEGTDEYLISFFFAAATERMESNLNKKAKIPT